MTNIAAEIDLQPLKPVLAEYAARQDIYGYLPRPALAEISWVTGVTPAKVLGVASFYTQFRLEPVGRYLIMLCQGTACHVNGSESIGAVISEELGIADGQTTEDGLFSLKYVACLGCCSLAPAMMINGEVYGNLTANSVRQVLHELAEREAK